MFFKWSNKWLTYHSEDQRWPTHLCRLSTQVTYQDDPHHHHINICCSHGNPSAQWYSHGDSSVWIQPAAWWNICLRPHTDRLSCRAMGNITLTHQPFPACLSPRAYCWFYIVDRQCMTLCPSQFSFENDCITIQYMDCKIAKHAESILCQYLALYSPQKGGGCWIWLLSNRNW